MHNSNPLVQTVLALGLIYSLDVKERKKLVIYDLIHIQFCRLHWTVNALSIGPYRTNKGHQTNSLFANLLFFLCKTHQNQNSYFKEKKCVKASVKI